VVQHNALKFQLKNYPPVEICAANTLATSVWRNSPRSSYSHLDIAERSNCGNQLVDALASSTRCPSILDLSGYLVCYTCRCRVQLQTLEVVYAIFNYSCRMYLSFSALPHGPVNGH
jgi:hypothetical protein